MLQDSMFDRDTEVASNSAVSFNNEDEAEELALARLEAELRALEVEEEALAREEVALRRGSASIMISLRSSRWASVPPAACTCSCSVSRMLSFELKLGSGDLS